MSDQDRAAAEEEDGNTEFSQHFRELAREEKGLAPDQGAGAGADRDGLEEREEEGRQDEGGAAREPGERPADEGPAGQDEAPDIWASADPKLREAHEATVREAERLDRIVRNQDGRLSATARDLYQLRQSVAGHRDPAGATAQGEEAADDEERMKQLREEFPEVAAPILDRMLKLENRLKAVEGAAQTVDQERTQAFLDHQEQLLDQSHGDWRERVSGDAFVEWAKRKPRHVREAILRNAQNIVDAEEVSDILARYKAETTAPETAEAKALRERRERQRAGARMPATKGPTGGGRGGEGGEFSSEWARLREQDRRRAVK